MSFNLDEFLPYRLSIAANAVSRRFARLYAAEAGLTIPEWRVLAHLSNSGTVSVRDITLRVNLDKSIVSRAAARLQESGLVRKTDHQTDRRLISLELTAEGHELMQHLGTIAVNFQAELRAELGDCAPGLEAGIDRLITNTSQNVPDKGVPHE